MPELDYVDDLELLEDYDLAEGASDFNSDDDERGRVRDGDEDEQSDYDEEAEKRELMNIVIGLSSALGGPEEVVREDGKNETVYRPGDDCLGCLRDLRKLWKHDDDDLARQVALSYASVNVLHNDLVPIVLTCAGTDERGDKLALAATDLIMALTWPMDVLGELRDVFDKQLDQTKLVTLPQLQRAQVNYKASIMRIRGGPIGTPERDFLSTVMNFILLPSLNKPRPNRTERDVGTINMCLHLFRNLLAIKDPTATSLDSTELVELSTLQSKLVLAMDRSSVLETLLMLASSALRRDFEDWNAITAECIYHLIAGTSPKALLDAVTERPRNEKDGDGTHDSRPTETAHMSDRVKSALLTSLMTEASQNRANVIASASSRHSRFGTTISFIASDGHRGVARQASSLRKSVEELEAEEKMRGRRRKGTSRILNEKGAPGFRPDWTKSARKVVIRWSDDFLKHGLEPLSRSLIEDLRREREKLGDPDVARIHFMQMATYFLDYFLLRRSASTTTQVWDPSAPKSDPVAAAQDVPSKEAAPDKEKTEQQQGKEGDGEESNQEHDQSEHLSDSVDATDASKEEWPMAMIGFFADKWPFALVLKGVREALNERNWLEVAACTRMWTTMLKVMEAQEESIDEEDRNGAEWVQANIHNDMEVHETAKSITVCYKRQTFDFLQTIIHFAYAYPRSLERFMKGRESMMVRAKVRVRKQMRQDGEQVADDEEVERRAQDYVEDAFKERVFIFNAFQDKLSSRHLADTCLNYVMRWQEFSAPKEQLDMVVRVMHRIAIKGNGRRMFYQAHHRAAFKKLLTQMPVIQAVAPKPAENLKQLIKVVQRSWDKLTPEEQEKFAEGKRAPRQVKTAAPPKDLVVKPGHNIDEQIGIAVGLLLEKELMSHVNWVKGALEYASSQRREIVLSTDGINALDKDEDGDVPRPSNEAMSKFAAYVLPYGEEDDQLKRDAATLPALKLFCQLVGLNATWTGKDECTWSIPAERLPEHLDEDIATIEKYIRSPFETNGEAFSSFVQNKRKERERKPRESLPDNLDGFMASDSTDGTDESDGEYDETARKKKRNVVYSSESEDGGLPSSDGESDDGVSKHQRALQRLLARKEKKKLRKEKEAARKAERAQQRKLKKRIFRPGDGGESGFVRGSRRGQTSGNGRRRVKLAVVPMFAGLEAALEDRIEDSDEEMAELDAAIARQQAEAGEPSTSSPTSQQRNVLESSPSAPVSQMAVSSPPTSPVRDQQSPLFRGQSESPPSRRMATKRRRGSISSTSPSPQAFRRPQRSTVEASPLAETSPRRGIQLSDAGTSSPARTLKAHASTNLSSPFVSPMSKALASSRKAGPSVASPGSSPMSRVMASSKIAILKRAPAIHSSSPGRSSPVVPSSGSEAIMSRWKAFASKSTRQEPTSAFVFSDNEDEDELDELADDQHGAAGLSSAAAFRMASQKKSTKASKSRVPPASASATAERVPLASKDNHVDDEDDELEDELDGGFGFDMAPVGTKARGMQGRASSKATAPRSGMASLGAVGDKRKRVLLSEEDE